MPACAKLTKNSPIDYQYDYRSGSNRKARPAAFSVLAGGRNPSRFRGFGVVKWWEYGANNPVTFTDSTGLDVIFDNSWNAQHPAQRERLIRANDELYSTSPYARKAILDPLISNPNIKVIVRYRPNIWTKDPETGEMSRNYGLTHSPNSQYVKFNTDKDGNITGCRDGIIYVDLDSDLIARDGKSLKEILAHELTHALIDSMYPDVAKAVRSSWAPPGEIEVFPNQVESYVRNGY